MSGPKLSEAELERIRQEQLERERQEALRRLQEAQSAYRKLCGRIRTLASYALDALAGLDRISQEDARKRLDQVLASLKEEPVQDTRSPQSYEAAGEILKGRLSAAALEVQEILERFRARTDRARKMGDIGRSCQTFRSYVKDQEAPVGIAQIDFQFDQNLQLIKKQLTDVERDLTMQLRESDSPDLRHALQRMGSRVRELQADADRGRDLGQIRGELLHLVNEAEDVRRRQKEKQALYERYLALAALTDTAARGLPDFPDAGALESEIRQLQQQYRKQDEMDYIADQINDAMVDLGYTFVSSHVLTRKGGKETDYSLYQADGRTGISVFTDRSGAVMMRMTVLGDDPVITEEDRDFSYQRQIDFCAAHPRLVEALAARGVCLRQKSYLEPDRKYTYKTDLASLHRAGTADTAGQTDGRQQKIDRRKRRRAGRKKVRSM